MATENPTARSRFNQAVWWSAAVALIVLGVYLSYIQFMNNEWLSRAGCVIVMLGLWSGIGGIFQEQLVISHMRWRRRNAIIKARARLAEEEVDAEEIARELGQINDGFEKQLSEMTQNLRLSLGVLEVSLLMTGTFLWGFGDLLAGQAMLE